MELNRFQGDGGGGRQWPSTTLLPVMYIYTEGREREWKET